MNKFMIWFFKIRELPFYKTNIFHILTSAIIIFLVFYFDDFIFLLLFIINTYIAEIGAKKYSN